MSNSDILETMKAKIDSEKIQAKFDMTSFETAYYSCRPTVFAFLAKYLLCFVVLGVHLLFWWVNTSNGLDDDANGFAKIAFAIVDFLGISGFVFFMLIVTWMNRFMNWSSSGAWYTVSLFIVTFTPALFVLDDIVATVLGWFGSEFQGVIPFGWDESWYLILGVAYFVLLTTLTIWYSRSFSYAVSDKAVYLKKDFMLNHTMHKIDMVDIDNMKSNQPWYGKILGFGTLNMLTGSGFGVRERTVSMSAGGNVAEAAAAGLGDDTGFLKKILKGMFFMIKLQRTREEMDTSEPEDCMYGIKKPKEVYRLISELKEAIRNQATTGQGTGQQVASTEEPAPVQPVPVAPVEAAPAEALDELDTDMNLG